MLVVACHRSRRGFSIMEDRFGKSATHAVQAEALPDVRCVTSFERHLPDGSKPSQTPVYLRKLSFRRQPGLFPLITRLVVAAPLGANRRKPSIQVRGGTASNDHVGGGP
jgi:hypothetical protein